MGRRREMSNRALALRKWLIRIKRDRLVVLASLPTVYARTRVSGEFNIDTRDVPRSLLAYRKWTSATNQHDRCSLRPCCANAFIFLVSIPSGQTVRRRGIKGRYTHTFVTVETGRPFHGSRPLKLHPCLYTN